MPNYAQLSRGNPPAKLVIRAADLCPTKGSALDIGAGSLRNAKYLLGQGFSVTAIDLDPVMQEEADTLQDPNLSTQLTSYIDFDFHVSAYDLIIAINSLPFESPANYLGVFERILHSLKPGGVLCMTFFGPNDGWAGNPKMTFHARTDIEDLCKNLTIHVLDEIEEEGKIITGDPKHWHYFRLIAQKR